MAPYQTTVTALLVSPYGSISDLAMRSVSFRNSTLLNYPIIHPCYFRLLVLGLREMIDPFLLRPLVVVYFCYYYFLASFSVRAPPSAVPAWPRWRSHTPYPNSPAISYADFPLLQKKKKGIPIKATVVCSTHAQVTTLPLLLPLCQPYKRRPSLSYPGKPILELDRQTICPPRSPTQNFFVVDMCKEEWYALSLSGSTPRDT